MKCIYLPIVFVTLCLIVSTYSVPVGGEPNQTGKKLKQAVTDNTGIVVSSNPATGISDTSDEDDDDDDEDGLEEVLVDDGDDDDEDDGDDEDDDEDTEDDEEDDEDDDEGEDGDYLERFFDDILGDDDDDDDDADETGEVAITNITSVINTPAPAIASAPIPQQLNPIEVVDVSSNLNTVDTEETQDEVVIAPEIQPNEEKTTKSPVYELVISQDEDGDEDDDFADGVIEARAINRLSKQTEESGNNGGMLPSAILSKYNVIVDGVYDKLNRILKKMYDPINVQLTKQSKRSESKNLKRHKIRIDARKSGISSNTKPKQRVNETTGGTKPVTKSKTRARGTMYGLSTLKRKGNIHVTSENHEDTIKSDFVLGPLVLKVSKSFSRGTKRELRSASAMTSKLRGRIVLKVNDGTTILHTIKIQQPKNVKIEVPGKKLNKSREVEWRKNLNIAQIVADQLSTVSRTTLHL